MWVSTGVDVKCMDAPVMVGDLSVGGNVMILKVFISKSFSD